MYIRQDIERVDALDKVLGRTLFAYDLKTDDMLFGCIVRSIKPHARIKKIDTRRALSVNGIVKVITSEDIPGENLFGVIKKDQHFLAQERVRYIGEPVLIVLGETEKIARKAAGFIEIEYEDIEAIFSPFEAMNSKTLLHDAAGNLLCNHQVIKGDVDRGFNDSDIIVEHVYKTTWLDHAYLETEAGIGYLDERGRITIRSSTQNIHYKRKEISKLLAIPEEEVRMIQAETGGGFGGKLDITVEGFIALSVYHTRRPVAIRYTREESFLSQTKRHPLYIEYKTGAKRDGSIVAVKVNIIGDTGPYISYGETVCLRSAIHAAGPYEIPNIFVNSSMFYTNNPVSGAMRGFGIPQLAFSHESQMDEIAELLGYDSLDIRMKNGLKKGSATSTSQVLENSVGFIETLKMVEPFWRSRNKANSQRGFGLGCMYYGIGNTGVSNPSCASLTFTEEGKIALHTGVCEIGQGSDTVLMQILCETLHMQRKDVVIDRGDTDTSKDAGSTSASRQVYISGMALLKSAIKMRSFLEDNGYYNGKSLKEIISALKDKNTPVFDGFFDPPTTPLDIKTSKGSPYATYAFATHMTEVEVDKITGSCKVIKVYAAHDVGKAINTENIRGQICGGIAMGIGFALMEEFIPVSTKSFGTYCIPTAMDVPDINIFIVEDEEPTGPFGAKGVGEPALIPQAASIVNAIKNATGARAYELPCNLERLKMLIEKREHEE